MKNTSFQSLPNPIRAIRILKLLQKTVFSEPSKSYRGHLEINNSMKNGLLEPSRNYQGHLELKDFVEKYFSRASDFYQGHFHFEDFVKNMFSKPSKSSQGILNIFHCNFPEPSNPYQLHLDVKEFI